MKVHDKGSVNIFRYKDKLEELAITVSIDSLLEDPRSLTEAIEKACGRQCRINSHRVLKRCGNGGFERAVCLINTDAGERWILKARNDRPSCRESLFYQTILRDSSFAPPYIGSATTDDGICLLVVKHLDGEVLGQSDFHAAVRTVLQFQMSVKIGQTPGEIMSEAFPDPIDYDDIRYIYETRLCEAEGRGRISRETVKILRGAAPYIAEVISQEPIVLDHGDVRPENFIMCSDGSVKMIDFENLGYRRRSTAVASMLCNWENSPKVLAQYALSIGYRDLGMRDAFLRAVAASSLWLGVRDGKSESELFRLHANLLVR